MKHVFVFLFALISAGATAQGGYRLYHEADGLRIYGKWKHEKPFGHGPYMLCVKVKNTTAEMVQASFSVQYFDGPLLAEDFQVGPLCIEGGKTLKGRAGNLCFVSQKFAKDQLFDEAFHWRVDDLETKEGCSPGETE